MHELDHYTIICVVDKSLELFSQMTAPDCPLPGVTFYDSNLGWCVLVDDDADAFAGWLARHTDAGTWVTMREATDEDRARLEELQHGR